MSHGYEPPRSFEPGHEVDKFECRSVEQTLWLRRYARQAHAAGVAKVFVVTPTGGQQVVAYYAWTMAQIAVADSPGRVQRGAGRYPQPVVLLARLGVDRAHEGQGLGAALMQDVFARLVALSDDIGCRGLLVHAESAEARGFYEHLVPEFERSPTDDMHLVLMMKDIRHTLR